MEILAVSLVPLCIVMAIACHRRKMTNAVIALWMMAICPFVSTFMLLFNDQPFVAALWAVTTVCIMACASAPAAEEWQELRHREPFKSWTKAVMTCATASGALIFLGFGLLQGAFASTVQANLIQAPSRWQTLADGLLLASAVTTTCGLVIGILAIVLRKHGRKFRIRKRRKRALARTLAQT